MVEGPTTDGAESHGVRADDVGAASPWGQRLKWVALATALAAYAALSHYSASSPDAKGLGAGLSVGPVLLVALVLVWRWTQPWIALLVGALAAALLYRYWPLIEREYQWADVAQQCGAYGLVAVSFGRSLTHGRVPLCAQLAQALEGAMLTPVEQRYLRRATVAWLLFYALLSVAILVLFFAQSLNVWSLFVNFGTFALILLMALGDHLIRQRVLPGYAGGGLLGVLRRALIG